MKIWSAGTTGIIERERGLCCFFKNRLLSYWYVENELLAMGEAFSMITTDFPQIKLFLDSGAFTAYQQGVHIDIQAYIAFIKKHENKLEVYANLDVIGDAEATWKNQLIMEEAGLTPLPVFHSGEDEKYLERYVEQYDYIALGGIASHKNQRQLSHWLDNLFTNYLCNKDGVPVIKTHGFGITRLKILFRYPWYSVDSTSWIITGRLGGIYVPYRKGGEWVYDTQVSKVTVSNRSGSVSEVGAHIYNMSPQEASTVKDYLAEAGVSLGKSEFKDVSPSYELKEDERWLHKADVLTKKGKRTVEMLLERGVCNDYKKRDLVNLFYFLELEKRMPKYPWAFTKKESNPGFGF